MEQIILSFTPLVIIKLLPLTYLSPPHEVSDIPDQVEHYHILSSKLGALALNQYFTGLRVKAVKLNF